MRIALISQDPPLDPGQVATGNQIRAWQLTEGLQRHGHTVESFWFQQQGRIDHHHAFNSMDRLRGLLDRATAQGGLDGVIVAYWELLAFLPCDFALPVVLDFLAPRPLECLFEQPDEVGGELARLQVALRDVDHVLVGNARQRHLMTAWLLAAGHDLRSDIPLSVVPLAGDAADVPADREDSSSPAGEIRLVAGGVHWPWRDDTAYREVLNDYDAAGEGPRPRLVSFGGRYRHHEEVEDDAGKDQALDAYQTYLDFLINEAHIGLELGAANVERHYSQSFRSLDYLRCGLPLICHDDLPIAALIREYDAGWTVADPTAFRQVLDRIMAGPQIIRQKADNARRLVRERLQVDDSVQPLVDFLEKPRQRRLLRDALPAPAAIPAPRLPVPGFRQRLRRQMDLLRQALFARIRPAETSDAIVIISRGDLFPANHGAAVKIVETARGLAANGKPVFLITDQRDAYWEVTGEDIIRHDLPWWLRRLALPAALTKLLHYSKDIPQSNAFLYQALSDRSFIWRTLYVGRRHGAQVFQAEFPGYCRPAIWGRSVLGGVAVLVQHNVEYDRLSRQIPDLSEARLRSLKALEIGLCQQMNAVICVSDNDRRQLARDGVDPERLVTIPHGVDLSAFNRATPRDREQLAAATSVNLPQDTRLVVFHGTYAYPPNRQALTAFADELLPRWRAMGLKVKVLAIGREPPGASPDADIILTGPVDDLAGWLKSAEVAVVPLTDGGGTRMKIIDYFAAGLPVVSTAKGIEGIPAVDGEQALIVDDWDELAEAVAGVLSDPARQRRLAQGGQALARQLDWRHLARDYLRVYRQAADN